MPTFGQIITDALAEINALTPGQAPDAGDIALGLTRGNAFLDSMNARSLMQYVKRLDSFPFAASQESYTIGRGTSPVADFVADRPVEILDAAVVLTTASPEVYITIAILTAAQWAAFSILGFSTSISAALWYETTFPNGTLHLRGIPSNTSYELRLLTNQQLGQAASISTQFVFPPGYYEAFLYSLAERLCNPFGKTGEIKADITMRARAARALVASVNEESPRISLTKLDGGGRGPYWNYLDNTLVY